MLRPMIQPLLRAAQWISGTAVRSMADYADMDDTETEDIYEGRLVHTDLVDDMQVHSRTGEVTLPVADTRGFEKDALIFVDGLCREWAVVKEVLEGSLLIRPRYGVAAKTPIIGDDGLLACALMLQPPVGTKVVLDEDPVLVTGAVVGEGCLHMSFVNGITCGARLVIGEGPRAERHRVTRSEALTPEPESAAAHIRTHDLVLFLDGRLRHNHGAHTFVRLDSGPTETVATVIVVTVMATTFVVKNLGLVNVVNGALSVAVIVGVVPGLCAWQMHESWDALTMPACIRHKCASLVLAITCVIMGVASMFFTDNHAPDLASSCTWRAG
mmetsp:Transcript_43938/g.140798  ORF Transcript_43938/g.140798 Transcript_43938/m.140798 type:complete len:327 (+) Transcript_43938:219-1199(+)